MNSYKSLPERRKATKDALYAEMDKLLRHGYNPFTQDNDSLRITSGIISPHAPIMEALLAINNRLEVSERRKLNLRHVLKRVGAAVKLLKLDHFPNGQVSIKVIKIILEAACKSPEQFAI